MSKELPNREQGMRIVSRLAKFGPLTAEELNFLKNLGGEALELRRGDVILSDADRNGRLYLLVAGWAASAFNLPNGARELVSLNLPGDLLGLPSLAIETPIDTVVALSTVSLRHFAVESLSDMFETQPRLAARLFLVAQEERVLSMERIALSGKTTGLSRIAALLLRLGERLAALDCGTVHRYEMPLTQKDLADLTGVTDVHVNGLIRSLREGELAIVAKREVHILNPDKLWKIAQISPWLSSTPCWLPPE